MKVYLRFYGVIIACLASIIQYTKLLHTHKWTQVSRRLPLLWDAMERETSKKHIIFIVKKYTDNFETDIEANTKKVFS